MSPKMFNLANTDSSFVKFVTKLRILNSFTEVRNVFTNLKSEIQIKPRQTKFGTSQIWKPIAV